MSIKTTTPVTDSERLGGKKAVCYEWRELVYENEAGLPIQEKAVIPGGIKVGDVIEIEYNYTSRPYPSVADPSVYDTAFHRYRVGSGWTALFPSGNNTIKAYQIRGETVNDVSEIKMFVRTDTQGIGIMSKYGATPPSDMTGGVGQSKLFRLKRVWKIHNV